MREETNRHPETRPLHVVTHHIRAWRNHRKMTMEMLGEACHLTPSMISQLELGRSRYTQQSLEAIAAALDVEPWQLLACDPETSISNSYFSLTDLSDSFWSEIPEEHHWQVEILFKNVVDASKQHAVKTAIDLWGRKPKPARSKVT
ncbi:helix-turn-helix transcriptional regulator [Mesorhizobium sp.]|uniref:helix-turn-helix domain-containing protein n=1 Tax=Mesorhizobium sp. TaxID=1871066 RepID=UPI000FE724BB|nr:helix-turn-helix transcriptional regulator [Mesorhizobium sp.]RWP05081.1 MAG: XRE family transcriptional regulator [Mesorhizobium sp.]